MITTSLRVVALLTPLLFFGVSPATGQAFSGFAGQMAMINMQHSVLQRSIANRVRQPIKPATAQTYVVANTQLNFRISPIRRKANLAAFIDRIRSADPTGAAGLEKLFASTDVIDQMGIGLAKYGLRNDNVADAFATWWTQSWQAAHNDASDPSRETLQAVKRQAVDGMLATSTMRTMNDATKQEFAETLLVQSMLFSSYVDSFKNDPAMMRKLGAAVREGAKASGLDLDSMTLTEQGFVPSGKTGAADPAPNAAKQALATNNVTTPSVTANDKLPPYLLLATAGGAGIGGVFLISKIMRKRG
jgi:hypothetical protein